jgi:hypothetical protein
MRVARANIPSVGGHPDELLMGMKWAWIISATAQTTGSTSVSGIITPVDVCGGGEAAPIVRHHFYGGPLRVVRHRPVELRL